MKKESRDLKPDIALKDYWRGREEFADIFNAVLFDGRRVIRPEELEDRDTDESYLQESGKRKENVKASRDNMKVRKRSLGLNAELVLLGIENQAHIHYAMPLRMMGYDYGAYKKQYDQNARKYRKAKGLTSGEYLSGMKKTDKFIPVITLVIYYGEKSWDGAVSLHGILDIPEGLEKYVNDYKMLLVEAGRDNLAVHNANNRDLFSLLKIILDGDMPKREAKEKAVRYSREHEVRKEVLLAVAGAAGSGIEYDALEKGEAGMCSLFEKIAEEGKLEGIAEGRKEGKLEGKLEGKVEGIIETGLDFGLAPSAIIERLQEKMAISLQMAEEYFNSYGKQKI